MLGTSSSESALPRLMEKLEHLGCAKPVVGLVVPTGYSFNLDGTSIYMTMAAIFVAQAQGVELSLRQMLGLLAVLLLTSKGAAAVTGSGFVTLAATLAVFPSIPIAGLTLASRRRSVHVGGPRDHEPDRQRRRDGRDREMGGRHRHGSRPQDSGAGCAARRARSRDLAGHRLTQGYFARRRVITTSSAPPIAVFPTVMASTSKPSSDVSRSSFSIVDVLDVASSRYSQRERAVVDRSF